MSEPGPVNEPARVGAGLRAAAPLLASVATLMIGLGLLQSLLGVRASIEGFPPAVTGVLMSSYYVGFLAGSIWIRRALVDVGHIRVFAALASLASAAFLLHGVFLQPGAWVVLRLVTGVCISGLTVVVESWLNGTADEGTRGQILSYYMILVFGGIGGGQLLLNVEPPEEVGLFVLASVLVSVAVVPVSLTPGQSPVVVEGARFSLSDVMRTAPVAGVTTVAAGMAHGALLTMGAVYATGIGLRVSQVSGFMAAAVIGGLVLQVPAGRLSDRIDRREVIALVAVLAGGAGIATALYGSPGIPYRIAGLAAALGAFSFPLYSLAAAHMNDRIDREQIVPAGAKLVLAYGVGAVIGPIAGSSVMNIYDPAAFMWFLAGIHGVVALYALFRLSRWSPIEVKGHYAPVPAGTTTLAFGLTPDAAEEAVTPGHQHALVAEGVTLAAFDAGEGTDVVFVHDAGSSHRIWRHAMHVLPEMGFRTIAYDLRGHGSSGAARSYGLESHVRDLEHVISSLCRSDVHLVGLGAGAVIAARYAQNHPVGSLALVSCARRIVSAVSARKLASRTTAITEKTLSQITGRRAHSRFLARTVYDPKAHPMRYELVAEDVVATQPRAMNRLYADSVLSVADVPRSRVHVVLGGRDAAVTPEVLGVYRRTFGDERVTVLTEAGYFVPMDDPVAFEEALARHFRTQGPESQ